MSRHDGVSCDSCLKSNFRGKRYKCLICYDYDLCATCYESGATSTRHTTDHPVQCIITRADFDIFYGGEALTVEQPQAFSCPYCTKMGFTEALLQEHVTADHADTSVEVVCPICASLPGGDPNHVTDDFAAHLTLEHRAPREFDEPTGIRHVRRIPHPGRGVGGARTRRATNMHFSGTGGASLTGLSPSGREAMDPIAELLSQLSSVRSRAAAAQSVTSQLQQLEMQLQSTRQQLERAPRRQLAEVAKATTAGVVTGVETSGAATSSNNNNAATTSRYLLARVSEGLEGEVEEGHQTDHARRSHFVQELLLSLLTEQPSNPESLDTLDKLSQSGLALAGPGGGDIESLGEVTDRSENASTHTEEAALPPTGDKENVSVAVGRSIGSESTCAVSGANAASSKSIGHKPVDRLVTGAKQKVGSSVVNGKGATGHAGVRVRQSSLQYQSQADRHSQSLHNVRQSSLMQNVELSNNLSMNVGGHNSGPGYDTENPQPLPGRPGSAGRDRDVNPATAKRTMVKHFPATKTSDREPPPH